MGRFLVRFVIVAALAGCGGGGRAPATVTSAAPAPAQPVKVRQVACDDGGSGGVLIDGVCL